MHYNEEVTIGVVINMQDFLLELGHQLTEQRRYKQAASNLAVYIRFLLDKNVPPIINLNCLSDFSGIEPLTIAAAVADPPSFYRRFEIQKRRGGTRVIEAPIPSLLTCQRWISENLLNAIPLHECATAYRKKVGLLQNVQPHLGQQQLLKLDLKDFFHSITLNRVIAVFRNMGYLPKTAYQLAALCCLHGRLPQGAATSPPLSNIIAKRMDFRLNALAKNNGLKYTRYSDDLAFSGHTITPKCVAAIRHIISSERFVLNEEKTRLYTGRGKRILTGISVLGTAPMLPRATKRAIRKYFHEISVSSTISTLIDSEDRDVFFLESLKGRLIFWSFVEPDATFPKLALKTIQKLDSDLRIDFADCSSSTAS